MTMLVDGDGMVLGRLASEVANRARAGEEVRIVNADKVVITGDRDEVFHRYKAKYDRGDKDHGPNFPRRPDRILKRTVRGMLPHRKSSGQTAYRNVRAYVGIPRELEGQDTIRVDDAELRSREYVTLGEVSKFLGSNF